MEINHNEDDNNDQVIVITPHLEGDLCLVANWAREELFKSCKFLYRGKKDLEPPSGTVYELFERDCMDSLPGVIAAGEVTNGVHYKKVYVKIIWDTAKERHIVSQALSLRRSCVYTVMQNRFNGKSGAHKQNDPLQILTFWFRLHSPDLVGECVTNKLVFPALEAFEERLANPTLYYLFYEYFLRAAVGEEKWKLSTGHHTTKRMRKGPIRISPTTTDPDKRMASSLDEAFALLVFKNNYFAWLMEAKQNHDGLVTDYDSGRSLTLSSPTLVQYLLNGSVLDLQWEEEEFYVLWKPVSGGGRDDPEPNFNSEYAAAFSKFKLAVQRIREKVKNSPDYQHLTDAMKELRETNDVDGRSRKKKKRKLLRDLKPYTGIRIGDEKAFRGWSKRAFVDLVDLKNAIRKEKDTYKRFGKAYRQLYVVQRKDTIASVLPVNLPVSKDVLDDEQYRQLFDLEDDD